MLRDYKDTFIHMAMATHTLHIDILNTNTAYSVQNIILAVSPALTLRKNLI